MNNNQKGFALIQVVIATALFSVLALAVASLISDQKNAIIGLEDHLEKIQLTREIESVLADTEACKKTFFDFTVALDKTRSVAITNIKDNNGNITVLGNANNNNLRVGRMSIRNISVPKASSSGLVELEVPLSRLRSKDQLPYKPYTSKLQVTVDKARKVTSCSSSSAPLSEEPNRFAITCRFQPTCASRALQICQRSTNTKCTRLLYTQGVDFGKRNGFSRGYECREC